jgi:hypothetical protein
VQYSAAVLKNKVVLHEPTWKGGDKGFSGKQKQKQSVQFCQDNDLKKKKRKKIPLLQIPRCWLKIYQKLL